MEKIILTLLAFLAVGICAAEVPDLVGNWSGSTNGYFEEDGSYMLYENGSINLTIAEQNDRLFTGNITYVLNGTETVKGFAGAIGPDNETLYMAELNEGYDIGTVISDDELELIYLADGESGWASIDTFHRMNSTSANE